MRGCGFSQGEGADDSKQRGGAEGGAGAVWPKAPL